jgi:hypothetical protein
MPVALYRAARATEPRNKGGSRPFRVTITAAKKPTVRIALQIERTFRALGPTLRIQIVISDINQYDFVPFLIPKLKHNAVSLVD